MEEKISEGKNGFVYDIETAGHLLLNVIKDLKDVKNSNRFSSCHDQST